MFCEASFARQYCKRLLTKMYIYHIFNADRKIPNVNKYGIYVIWYHTSLLQTVTIESH